jgi:hypothetical protein
VSRNVGGLSRKPEPEEPAAPHATVTAYVIVRDGAGWRPSILELPADVAARHLVRTWEPDLFGLAKDKLDRHIEERAATGGR